MEEKAKNAIYHEVEAMKKGDFAETDLQNAKNSIIRSLKSVESSLGSLNGYLFSLIFSEENVTQEETIKLVNSVTREEVIELANTVNPELFYVLGAED
jgi:predicted Zn-dependent peptidase